jgi:hypothetical protein
MQSTKELADAIYRERVEKARGMSPEDKLPGGPRLFDHACSLMLAGIRSQFPDADERRVQEILRERLAVARRLENRRSMTIRTIRSDSRGVGANEFFRARTTP